MIRQPGVLSRHDRAAFLVLGLEDEPDTYDVQAVDARWRQLRTELHPDKPGGDAAKFSEAKKAYDAARFYALEPKPCPSCNGTGKQPAASQRGGFAAPLQLRCDACRGSGRR